MENPGAGSVSGFYLRSGLFIFDNNISNIPVIIVNISKRMFCKTTPDYFHFLTSFLILFRADLVFYTFLLNNPCLLISLFQSIASE